MNEPRIDADRFFADAEALRGIGRQPDGAVHRVAYSEADRAARDWLRGRLADLGLAIEEDAAGNTVAHYPGLAGRPPIGIGSHTDTVPMGGAYDGALGVVAALAVIEALHRAGRRLQHPLALVNFAAEEATMAGGTTGSQAMTGLFDPAILDRPAWDGRPVREHMAAAGLDPEAVRTARREPGSFAAFLELHIEQSRQLESAGASIAVVDSFVGIRRYGVRVRGEANHAGTTPMAERDDALLKALPLVQAVNEIALELGIIGTVGRFVVHPGAPNVIPERVEMVVEIRGGKATRLDQARELITRRAEALGGEVETIVEKPPVRTSPLIQAAIRHASERLGLRTHEMSSGAGHDAMNMARLCPTGIFFVPSRGGISHSKEEFTSPEDCLNGAKVYLEAVMALDELLCEQEQDGHPHGHD